MASGVKLVYTFTDADGKKVQYSYNHAKASATTAQVTAAATALITNTAVLAKTLVSLDSVKSVITEESYYDISEYSLATANPREIINGNPDIPEADDNTVTEVTRIEPSAQN